MRNWRCGEELFQEDVKDCELLRIDMERGIRSILPATLMESSVVMYAPTEVRRIR